MSKNIEITPDYVKSLKSFTDTFLCNLDDNIYNLNFINFVLKSIHNFSNKKEEVIIELKIDSNNINEEIIKRSKEIKDIYKNPRMIRYHLKKDLLNSDLKLTLKFKNRSDIGYNLKMIENHYHDNELIGQIFHNFGFCIPNSENARDIIYKINSQNFKEISNISGPFEIKTDTFFFANDKLIIHNKTLFYFSQK